MKYKHIIWDWNGTLLNDAWFCVDVMNGLLTRRKLPLLTLKRYQEVFDFPVIDYYKRLGFDFNKESFQVSGTEFIVEYEKRRHEIQLQPETKQTLQKVVSLGITQSLLSAYKQQTLDELVDFFGLSQFFVSVIGLEDHYAYSKIETGKRLMAELHENSGGSFSTKKVLFVGDTLHDHEVANTLGIDCLLISSGHQTREKLEKSGVPVLKTLAEVYTFLHDIL